MDHFPVLAAGKEENPAAYSYGYIEKAQLSFNFIHLLVVVLFQVGIWNDDVAVADGAIRKLLMMKGFEDPSNSSGPQVMTQKDR